MQWRICGMRRRSGRRLLGCKRIYINKISFKMIKDIEKEISEKILTTNFIALEESLGLSKDFFHKIFSDEFDWSLVIKLSVIIEAAIDRLLKIYFENLPENFISKLNINGSAGKIQLLSDLSLINQQEKNRIIEIFKIRNKFAHRIEFIEKNILQYYLKLNQEESQNFFQRLLTGENNPNKPNPLKEQISNTNTPRIIFFTACIISLILITNIWQRLIAEKMMAEAPTLMYQLDNSIHPGERELIRKKLMNLLEKLEDHPWRLIEIDNKASFNDSTAPTPSPAA